MYTLIKFFSDKTYAEQFKKGRLYLNSLGFFKNSNYKIGTPLNQLTKMDSVFDYREGSVLTFKNKILKNMLPSELGEYIELDPVIDLIEYEFCHLLCFYRVDMSIVGFDKIVMTLPPINSMEDFGNTVAIITDTEKFIKRVEDCIKKKSNSLLYNMGSVRYRNLSINCNILAKDDSRFPMESLVFRVLNHDDNGKEHLVVNVMDFIKSVGKSDISYRDCFVKNKKYEYQNEWRICLYDSKSNLLHTKEPIEIEVGDLSDIVQICNINELDSFMKHIVTSANYFPINAPKELLFGNISRKNFRSVVIEQNPYGTIFFNI